MKIYLENLDSITQIKYKEFSDKVRELLGKYQETDLERFEQVKNKIEQTNGNWDTGIELINKDEDGNTVDMETDGIDFINLSEGQSFLTNLRQTVFHE